jgi:hypothetical protein
VGKEGVIYSSPRGSLAKEEREEGEEEEEEDVAGVAEEETLLV